MKRIPLYILLLASLNGFSKETNVKGFFNNPHFINNQNISNLNNAIENAGEIKVALPPIVQDVNKTICDDDGVDDGQKLFDLTSLIPEIIVPPQDPDNYDVHFFMDPAHTNPIPDLTNSTNIRVYVEVTDRTTGEKSNAEIFITVVAVPNPVLLNLPVVCYDNKTGQVTAAGIESGYAKKLYDFEWRNSDGNLVSEDNNYYCDKPGDYTLKVTAKSVSNCESGIINFTVKGSAKPTSVTFATSGWFSDNQTITVLAEPYFEGDTSNFLYSLDGQPSQKSNVFNNVKIGLHEVVVSNVHECGAVPLPIDVHLVYGPKSFTPNGDGINDRWNITGLEEQKDSELFIFDRHGKLIVQMFTNGDGWDGTLNGHLLPSTDYWFKINYKENGNQKEYKSHFSLLR